MDDAIKKQDQDKSSEQTRQINPAANAVVMPSSPEEAEAIKISKALPEASILSQMIVPPKKAPTLDEKMEQSIHQSAIRTYESDVAEAIAHGNVSSASMILAEQQKRERERHPPNIPDSSKIPATDTKTRLQGEDMGKMEIGMNTIESRPMITEHPIPPVISTEGMTRESKKKMWISIASIALIVVGIGGAYYLYSQSPLTTVKTVTPVATQTYASMITSDSVTAIPIDDLSAAQIVSKVQTEESKPSQPNTVKEIILTKTQNGQTKRATITGLLAIFDISAPDMFTRSLTDSWMLGVYSGPDSDKDIFIVVTHNLFQNAFAGMLSWENSMADDLKQLLYATSTNEQQFLTPYGGFVDGIVKSKDTREFQLNTGQVLFIYSFVDNNKLVFTGRESTLSEILSRLEHGTFVR